MKIDMSLLREIVSDLVREEMTQVIDEAVQKRMRSLAVSLIAESRLASEERANGVARAERRMTEHAAQQSKRAATSVMTEMLHDTAQHTLPKITQADAAVAAQDRAAEAVSDKLTRLAFSAPMPTRASTVPSADASSAS